MVNGSQYLRPKADILIVYVYMKPIVYNMDWYKKNEDRYMDPSVVIPGMEKNGFSFTFLNVGISFNNGHKGFKFSMQ